jgi:serine phosphatase RsbU (regulator of sigma subunit)
VSQPRRLDALEEKLGPKPRDRRAARSQEDYWQRVQDLFTRDVTVKALRELAESDARDTVAFFTREVDFEDLKARSIWERVPASVFRVFEAIAWRLSPARRILFAGATFVLAFHWLSYAFDLLSSSAGSGFPAFDTPSILLVAASLLFIVLALELRDKLTLKGDLEIARQIQFGLLPFEPYAAGTLRVLGAMRPANTVGGDYFDIVDLGEGRTALVIGDVAGKGMPAALLMALVQGSLRTLVTAGLRGPALVARLNQHLSASIPANRLVTLFYAETALAGGPLQYVNAGHNPPLLLRRDGTMAGLGSTGAALGIMADAAFEMAETPFEAGDRLLMYTDGVVEADNPKDEEYGEARLRTFFGAHREAPDASVIEALIGSVLAHAGPVKPRDDMTVLIAGREA